MIHHIASFFKKYRHIWLLSYGFLYLPWFCYLERTVKAGYHIMHVTLDDYIPFCEYFVIPYLMWFLYVGSAILFFLFKSKEDYYRLCQAGGSLGYFALLKLAHLSNPFEEGTVEKIVRSLEEDLL